MVDLKNLSEDVKARVELVEQQNMRATRTVKGWLRKIDLVEVDVDRILQQGDGSREQMSWKLFSQEF